MAILSRKKPHVLLLPFPGQSHIPPMMNIAYMLLNHDITITLASFRKIISSIRSKYAKELQGLDFHLVELDNDPEEDDEKLVEVTVPCKLEALRHGCQPYVEKLEADRQAGNSIPTCIIAGFFLVWTEEVAVRLGMKRYILFPNSAILPRFTQQIPELLDKGILQCGEVRKSNKGLMPFDGVLDISDVPAGLKYHEIPYSARNFLDVVLAMNLGKTANRSILVNTFYELDSKAIDSYNNYFPKSLSGTKAPRMYPIGPIITMARYTSLAFNGVKETTGVECMRWLEGQPAASVLYICLGSMVRLCPKQIEQLALALEATENCRFLWVLHKGNGNFDSLEEVLPPGFEAKVEGRGMVTTGWVPQLQILAHSAVLGFLTHSGWSSTMESLTSGVPMISWPHGAEQFLNCRHMVEMKVAVEVVRDADGIVQQEEFERAFGILLGEQGKRMTKVAQELKAKGESALTPGGSSHEAFLQLVEEIKL
ncbi:hypothetical protein R1flu_021864 [Riccia fluitans]|uniref:Glycosyltransferase n=1 Tax=Riccia fluitans TaxID=41844 RepID=A0ABD1ZSF2_9MARC